MANAPLAVAKLAPECGLSHAALKSYVKPLVLARIVPPSGPGGGRGTVHINDIPLARIVLASTSPGPERALEAVQSLSALPPQEPQAGDFTCLLDHLAARISQQAHRILHGEPPDTTLADAGWALYTCLDPLLAWETWTRDGQEQKRVFAQTSAPPRRGVWFLARIDSRVLDVAGELYADTLIQTAPQRETAALPQAAAPSRSRDVTTTPPLLDTRGDTGKPDCRQGRPARAPGKVPRKNQELS
jgi:hypothetical protein